MIYFLGLIMEDLIKIASYLYTKYKKTYDEKMDEMKLHKLLYFVQRESYIVNSTPLFNENFEAWKYGPVLKRIRQIYLKTEEEKLFKEVSLNEVTKNILDFIFENYAGKDSWALSKLTHNEYSWKNARKGIPENINSNRLIKKSDILIDANRIKERRAFLQNK